MPDSITFKPVIADEVEELRVGDKIDVSGGRTYAETFPVCNVFEEDEGVIVAMTVGGNWPHFILETVSDDYCQLWKPESTDDGTFSGFTHIGDVRKFQHHGRETDTNYDASETMDAWYDNGELPDPLL